MYQIGMWEMIVILIVVLLLFGAKRLPEVGKSLGQGIREFKKSLTAASLEEDDTPENPKINQTSEPPLNKHNHGNP